MLAPAKINLYLHVVGRRPDGYHLLDSLVAFASIGDELSVAPASELDLAISGPFSLGLSAGPLNLAMRAAQSLRQAIGWPAGARLNLTKNIPIASGIGGGSSDAALALRLLADLWGASLDRSAMMALALGLGADVPVCLEGRACFLGGIGEELAPAGTLPRMWVVLANPGVATPTQAVFKARSGPFSKPARWDHPPKDFPALIEYLRARRNDLTEPARVVTPEIGEVLGELGAIDGSALARLSGSGATCFALFESPDAAQSGERELRRRRPGWWIRSGSILT
jgi:4-diphosphocytidyl-2-C-methyl-D-erythritol kinase